MDSIFLHVPLDGDKFGVIVKMIHNCQFKDALLHCKRRPFAL